MNNMGLILGVFFWTSSVFAQSSGDDIVKSTVTDVTAEYAMLAQFAPTPTPAPAAKPSPTPAVKSPTDPKPSASPTASPSPSPAKTVDTGSDTSIADAPTDTVGGVDIGKIIALGEKIWDFILTNKPDAEYTALKTSIVPEGITNWAQLNLSKSKAVSKIYRVEFTTIFGGSAGGFDYRITYFPNGSYKGKGNFLGQISVVPLNVQLHTDRTLKMKAELEAALNFGSDTDPIAGAQILVTWSSPTTTRYVMNSAEYVIYGTGEIIDLTNGN